MDAPRHSSFAELITIAEDRQEWKHFIKSKFGGTKEDGRQRIHSHKNPMTTATVRPTNTATQITFIQQKQSSQQQKQTVDAYAAIFKQPVPIIRKRKPRPLTNKERQQAARKDWEDNYAHKYSTKAGKMTTSMAIKAVFDSDSSSSLSSTTSICEDNQPSQHQTRNCQVPIMMLASAPAFIASTPTKWAASAQPPTPTPPPKLRLMTKRVDEGTKAEMWAAPAPMPTSSPSPKAEMWAAPAPMPTPSPSPKAEMWAAPAPMPTPTPSPVKTPKSQIHTRDYDKWTEPAQPPTPSPIQITLRSHQYSCYPTQDTTTPPQIHPMDEQFIIWPPISPILPNNTDKDNTHLNETYQLTHPPTKNTLNEFQHNITIMNDTYMIQHPHRE